MIVEKINKIKFLFLILTKFITQLIIIENLVLGEGKYFNLMLKKYKKKKHELYKNT